MYNKLFIPGLIMINTIILFELKFHSYMIEIESYSKLLFVLLFVIPCVILFALIIVFKHIYKKNYRFIVKFNMLYLAAFTILIILIGIPFHKSFLNFSSEKWKDKKYCDVRYVMVDNLKSKHSLIGYGKEDVYNLLGLPNVCEPDYEKKDLICYSIRFAVFYPDVYPLYLCLNFNDNNQVESVNEVDNYHN